MKIHLYVLAASTLFLSSCYTHYHFPERVDIAGVSKKGELHTNASWKPSISSWGSISADAAYAVTDQLFIAASYRHINNLEGLTLYPRDAEITYNGFSFSGGIGGFTSITESMRMEVSGGYGRGTLNCDNLIMLSESTSNSQSGSYAAGRHHSGYNRFYAQTAVTYKGEDHFKISAGFQLSIKGGYHFKPDIPNGYSLTTGMLTPFVDVSYGNKVAFDTQFGVACQSINGGTLLPRMYLSLGFSYNNVIKKEKKKVHYYLPNK